MQSIAEEVVSSSGGGGTYITSGFSNYVGHSAIGAGYSGAVNPDKEVNVFGWGIIRERDIGTYLRHTGQYIDGMRITSVFTNMDISKGDVYLSTIFSAAADINSKVDEVRCIIVF